MFNTHQFVRVRMHERMTVCAEDCEIANGRYDFGIRAGQLIFVMDLQRAGSKTAEQSPEVYAARFTDTP